MIEFLVFGNVTVAVAILVTVALTLALINQLFLWIGHLVLSLDNPNAPDILKENWVWSKLPKTVMYHDNLVEDDGGYYLKYNAFRYYDRVSEDRWSNGQVRWKEYCKFSSKEEAMASKKYMQCHEFNWGLLGGIISIDLVILWLQHHFLSAVWVLSTVGIVLMLRYISNALWNTQSKTKDNTDRIQKIENTLKED
tara:strand:+ start:11565 stop:12149 length:585 start_codon:yes stop_codon:yes gene_type:complete